MKSKNIFEITVYPDKSLRLDQLIVRELPEYSRTRIKNWIRSEKILVNGVPCLPKDKINKISQIQIEISDEVEVDIIAQDLPIEVVYDDSEFLVINKFSNVVTHTAVGNYEGTLQNALIYHYPFLKKLPRAGIIHRLDKPTSGLLIIAKNLNSLNILSSMISERKIIKKYKAITYGGALSPIVIDRPIARHRTNRKKMCISARGKNAKTIVHKVINKDGLSVLDIEIITGRTHQIRAHLSDLGHPILGDTLYGYRGSALKKTPKLYDFLQTYKEIALHSYYLRFKHPTKSVDVEIECLPGDTFNVISSLVLDN